MDNILRIAFKGKTEITVSPLYQYDYGRVLRFVDLQLPVNYEVHFANRESGTAITMIGNSNGVQVPDGFL